MSEQAPSKEQENEVQSLPPRSEVHKQKNKEKKKKRRYQYLFLRLLVVAFIVLPVAVYYFTNQYIIQKEKELEENSQLYEKIFFESATQPEQQKTSGQTGTFTFHKVKEGETLESIAKQYFPNDDGVAIILKYNTIQNNNVKAGQVLKIPSR